MGSILIGLNFVYACKGEGGRAENLFNKRGNIQKVSFTLHRALRQNEWKTTESRDQP